MQEFKSVQETTPHRVSLVHLSSYWAFTHQGLTVHQPARVISSKWSRFLLWVMWLWSNWYIIRMLSALSEIMSHDNELNIWDSTSVSFSSLFFLLLHHTLYPHALPLFPATVPANFRARPIFLFGGGCIHSTKPEFWDHQEAGVSKPTSSGSLHVPLCEGQIQWKFPLKRILNTPVGSNNSQLKSLPLI